MNKKDLLSIVNPNVRKRLGKRLFKVRASEKLSLSTDIKPHAINAQDEFIYLNSCSDKICIKGK
jgi:hypothetical protein